MRILLLGEYSNVHTTLAEGLRCLGHEVCTAHNGDFWKNYPRDIDFARQPGKMGGLRLVKDILINLHNMKDYDVVQIINPMFVELKAARIRSLYQWLRKHNKKMFLGAFGMDYYWVHENMTRQPLRYSDFNIGSVVRDSADALRERQDWLTTDKGRLNQYIANDCDGIITGLYEYQACYAPVFPDKTTFIPFPIKPKHLPPIEEHREGKPLKIFIGISKGRNAYKGTDIMLKAAQAVCEQHPEKLILTIAEGVPFDRYTQMMTDADIILDQLYSYTPAMNALEAMSRGVVCVGGGEPENYQILGEHELKPIINVTPDYESVFHEIEKLVTNPHQIPILKRQGLDYIGRHHDYIKVAQRYIDTYMAHPW